MIKLFTAILMLLIAGALLFGFTRPTYEDVQNLQGQSVQLDQILTEAAEFQRLKSQLISRYNALPSDQLARLSKLLPDHVDNVRLILDVDSLAAQNNLTLENVIINSGEDAQEQDNTAGALGAVTEQRTPYDSLILQFTTVGSYQDFVTFLNILESSLRLVDISNLSLQAAYDGDGVMQYTYDVKVRTYWLK